MMLVGRFWRDTWALLKPYWASKEKGPAWLLLGAVVGLTLATVYMNVLFNGWYNSFYDALQAKDRAQTYHQLLRFCVLAAIYIAIAVYLFYLNQWLQLRWRRWMTGRYLREWLVGGTYYRLQVAGPPADNPDQRIAEDLRLVVDGTLSLGLGLLNAVVTLGSFVGILWRLSGPMSFRLGRNVWALPGYLVWLALLYAAAGTWLTHRLGRPLVKLNFQQQRYEADFRFGLVRFRESAEQVALSRGERDELTILRGRFRGVLDNFWRIVKRQKILNFFTVGYNQAAVIFPFVVGLPRFLSGAIQLGGLIQISNAFGQVQTSLSWFVGAYTTFAAWRATADRLQGFRAAMRQARREMAERPGIAVGEGREDALVLDHLTLSLPDGQQLLPSLDTRVQRGESLLVRGPSGCGKSTLFRAIAGVWPFGSGAVEWPAQFDPMFLPQRPYLPLGTLREVVSYPARPGDTRSEEVAEALRACDLAHLVGRLDESRPWALELSPGEQQRIAFARVLLHRPSWLFLDEATSAVDSQLELRLYGLLAERLKDTTLVSIGHREGLARYHARTLELGERDGGRRQLPRVS